ncbi:MULTISPECIES: type II toxin-antitoxin system PemK/MazF family toxin [Spirulina sp. CCY15215]|uniref:type II toxin-antitoxin system PemK/MazF family toxin n=1 Tax=Spirulina sp. CCY15215 TaxID=2767591 RepID=UPI00194F5B0E|nr:type II toxin-antitoxin system PemK/MazF family toxin [Spirulina major]
MTIYKFGDVILVPFPFTDQTTIKKRPAIVISSDMYNQIHIDLIAMAITSQLKSTLILGEIVVNDWSAAGLLKPSIIKPVVMTVEKGLILRKLGKLEESDRLELKKTLQSIFG